jgi:hypothetical protein
MLMNEKNRRRHPRATAVPLSREVLAVFGEVRKISRERLLPSFETPRKCAAPQDDGLNVARSRGRH